MSSSELQVESLKVCLLPLLVNCKDRLLTELKKVSLELGANLGSIIKVPGSFFVAALEFWHLTQKVFFVGILWGDRRYYCVGDELILYTEDHFLHQFGFVRKLALDTLLDVASNANSEPCCPALILSPFERIGSTWTIDMLDMMFSRGYTEPLRQHIHLTNPLCPLTHFTDSQDNHSFHSQWKQDSFTMNWFSYFYSGLFGVPGEVQVVKETNVFFLFRFLVDLFPANSPIIILTRQIEGIISSFKVGQLFERWNYAGRYNQTKTVIAGNDVLSGRYARLIADTDEKSWIDCILTLYVISVCELQNSVFSRYPKNQVIFCKYEDNAKDVSKLIAMYQHMNIDKQHIDAACDRFASMKKSEKNSDFNTSKKSKDPFDWRYRLTSNEFDYIQTRKSVKFDTVAWLIPDKQWFFETFFGNKVSCCSVAKGTIFKKRVNVKQEYSLFQYSRSEVIESIGFQHFKKGEYCFPSTEHVSRSRAGDKRIQTDFDFSETYVTNEQYASFLNFLSSHGIRNTDKWGQYFFVNPNMISERGGRLFVVHDSNYTVVSGFEAHPVNWVSWLGAAVFAKWVGMRLPTEHEWEYVVHQSIDLHQHDQPELFANVNHAYGDTTPVTHFPADEISGVYDIFGNVRTWCSEWYCSRDDNPSYLKSVCGGAWNKDLVAPYERDYKSWLLSARGLGFRLVRDHQCELLAEDDYLSLINNILKRISKNCTSRDALTEIAKCVDRGLS